MSPGQEEMNINKLLEISICIRKRNFWKRNDIEVSAIVEIIFHRDHLKLK